MVKQIKTISTSVKEILFFTLFQFLLISTLMSEGNEIDNYNVSWTKPSKIVADAMPLGNGTTGALVSVLKRGKIWVSVRHVDAWSEAHRLLKLGDVEITVSPNPFKKSFKQELILSQGAIILLGDNGFRSTIWVDANNSVIHLENSSTTKFKLDVKLHNWRDKPKFIIEENFIGLPSGIKESADIIVENDENAIIWYHQNSHNRAFELAIKTLEIPMSEDIHNVLENRIFGGLISGDLFSSKSNSLLTSKFSNRNSFSIYTSVKQERSSENWLKELKKTLEKSKNRENSWLEHVNWWNNFWESSYIHLSGSKKAKTTSAGYAYAMYLNAMAGKGEFPIAWNGSMFSPPSTAVPIRNHTGTTINRDPDFRAWENIMLHQNVRLPYYSMYASGQFLWTKSFFDLYMRGFQLMKEHTKAVFGHDGTVIRESTTLWGIVAPGIYGFDREGLKAGEQKSVWHRTHWQSGLEVAFFMGDYFEYTQDRNFATNTFIPFANEIVKFFDLHWSHKNGKLYFPHVYAMETFRDTDNPMPLVAGMKSVLQQLLKLPHSITKESDRKYWKQLLAKVPEIPLREKDGKMILANAQEVYSNKVNVEVSELYAVFPYHLYGVGLPDLEMAQETYRNRTILVDDVGGKNPIWARGSLRGGWRQESVMSAMLGLTDEAKSEVSWALNRRVSGLRYPGFFKSTYDGVPDVQHSSLSATALQRMILQDVGDKIVLLPAWPIEWNCKFKLYAKKNTIVEGEISDGKLINLKVMPQERREDVVIQQIY